MKKMTHVFNQIAQRFHFTVLILNIHPQIFSW